MNEPVTGSEVWRRLLEIAPLVGSGAAAAAVAIGWVVRASYSAGQTLKGLTASRDAAKLELEGLRDAVKEMRAELEKMRAEDRALGEDVMQQAMRLNKLEWRADRRSQNSLRPVQVEPSQPAQQAPRSPGRYSQVRRDKPSK